VNPVRHCDLRLNQSGVRQVAEELGPGECTGYTSGPLLHVPAGCLVHIVVGNHVAHREAAPGAEHPGGLGQTRALSDERLITQFDITTSSAADGDRLSLWMDSGSVREELGTDTFHFFSLEESRMHVHVQSPEGEIKIWLEPEVELARSYGLSAQDVQSSPKAGAAA